MKSFNKIPPLNGLKTFESVARHLSMSKAAAELFITHGAVSRQIKILEDALGTDLFVRRNRAIFLTPAGVDLYVCCGEIFLKLLETIETMTSPIVNRPLVVSCEPTIAMRWLIGRLPNFQALYPNIVVHLFTAGGAVGFAEKGIDLAIRRNDFEIDCYTEELATEMVGPVCIPELEQDVLRTAVRLHSNSRLSAWQKWCEQTHHEQDEHGGGDQYFEHFYLSLQAASSGLGVAIASQYMVEQELIEKRLVAPFGFTPDGSRYCLLSQTDFENDERKQVFLAWLRAHFKRPLRS